MNKFSLKQLKQLKAGQELLLLAQPKDKKDIKEMIEMLDIHIERKEEKG